ncbi:uncharacterized protein GGS22DRAFT_168424 [Annulohypoxylon maeteangense]|uniref:uncharacterized protein n=1 Tax=Annulohypoxylon maeteangense TaxID=1927788 RepID=UPI002007A47E|nr:uncharacterized protein GGS22DRAFT_168424 [Annulohypoxylon maeteangense]KAI0883326.1 hypothetical protein GGS22DRAFT_168424 [Annulohypoxylon maeteangense]
MTPNLSEQNFLGEKATLPLTQTTQRPQHVVKKMPSARHFFLTLLLGLLFTTGLANGLLKQQPSNEVHAESKPDHVVHRDDSTFSRLLSSASPQALHHFLHTYFPATYKHGVYDSDHAAMEAVHANDPELATSIVQMAKRQQSSGNDTTAAVTTSTSTETSAATSTSQSTTTQESTAETSSTTRSSASTSDAPTSTVTSTSSTQTDSPTTTTTTSSGSTETTSTPGSTLATATTSSVSTTASPRTSTFTSTLPGGAKTTITSVEVVTPGASEAASTTSGTSGSLQSGVGRTVAVSPIVEVFMGVIVGGALLV